MVEYLTYRRWRLRDGVDIADVHALVRDRIVPHYHRLDPTVRLELEMIDRTRSVLAVQRWPDRARYETAVASDGYTAWLDAYRPILRVWDGLVEFEAEWETSRLI